MPDKPEALAAAYRNARRMGWILCGLWPGVLAALLLGGVVRPGTNRVQGAYQQLGYLFTGLVFLSAAWAWWRSGRVLGELKALPPSQRPAVVFRECLVYAVVFETSSLCGLIYWSLVGAHAARHAWGFILLTPMLFLALVPSSDRWRKAAEG